LETEIDLLKYVRILLRRWYIIVGVGLLFAVIAYFVTSRPTTPLYRATALIVFTRNYLDLQLVDEFRTINQAQNVSRAYPELATSDEVLGMLAEAVTDATGEPLSLLAVRGMASAEIGEDNSLLRLNIINADPDTAALLVNEWADLFVRHAERVYGVQGEATNQQLQEQLERAQSELAAISEAVLAFRESDQVTILANQLSVASESHIRVLDVRERMKTVLADATRLQQELAKVPSSEAGSGSDQMTLFLLQMKAYGLTESAPLAVQLTGDLPASENTVGQQVTELSRLISALEQKQAELDEQVADLEATVLRLQTQHQAAISEQTNMLQEQTIAQEAYATLARKVEEVALATSDAAANVRFASRADVPELPMAQGGRQMMVVAGAALVGMALASLGVLAFAAYRERSAT